MKSRFNFPQDETGRLRKGCGVGGKLDAMRGGVECKSWLEFCCWFLWR